MNPINPSANNPFALSLMGLLAIRLGCQKTPAKSLVMSKGVSWFNNPAAFFKAALMTSTLLITTPASAEELGRLFFTPQQRTLLEYGQHPEMEKPKKDKPKNDNPKDGKPKIIDSLTVSGIVQRHGGERTVWINGVPQLAGQSDERAPESVPVAIPGQSQPVMVKVGQKVQINQPTPQKAAPPNLSESDD